MLHVPDRCRLVEWVAFPIYTSLLLDSQTFPNLAGWYGSSFHQSTGLRPSISLRLLDTTSHCRSAVHSDHLSMSLVAGRQIVAFAQKGSGLGTFRRTLDRILHSLLCSLSLSPVAQKKGHRPTTTFRSYVQSTFRSTECIAPFGYVALPCYSRSFRAISRLLRNTHSSQMHTFHRKILVTIRLPAALGCHLEPLPASLTLNETEFAARCMTLASSRLDRLAFQA